MSEYPEFDKPGADHVVINSLVDGGRFECENCGCDYSPSLPCPINVYLAMANSFLGDHRECEVRTKNRLGNARLPKELREEESDEETEQECETCGGEGTIEGPPSCHPYKCCGQCTDTLLCPDCGSEDDCEPRGDLLEADYPIGQDEVDWESPI